MKGKKEASIEIAKKLLSENMSIEKISDITELPVEELLQIQKENK